MNEKGRELRKEGCNLGEDEYLKKLSQDILDAARRCRNCNYCYSMCPLRVSTIGFQTQGPSGILQALYYGIRWDVLEGGEGHELCRILYNCTTCNSCVVTCKDKSAGMPLLEVFEKGRNLLVEKMLAPLEAQRSVLRSIERYGNPYQRAASERAAWLDGEGVKRIPEQQAEVILFIGCTTSYEADLFPLGRALVRILKHLDVDFGVLANERCCADPVCRIGDRSLFNALSEENRRSFHQTEASTIVTVSPHCMNVFIKDYEELAESFSIRHYTEFLYDILKTNGMFRKPMKSIVTYHDPCYLSKHHKMTDLPRDLLRKIPGLTLVEMKNNRQNSLCCGAGGGRMYAEVEETERLANMRIRQALDNGADVLATACPYCHVMLLNACRDLGVEKRIRVLDIAELTAQALGLTE